MTIVEQTEARAAAEAAWRRVIEAQRDDLALLRRRWPDRTSPESAAALERLTRRTAPGGEAERAVGAVHAAWGGSDRVPPAVREGLERYTWERLTDRPWPGRSGESGGAR